MSASEGGTTKELRAGGTKRDAELMAAFEHVDREHYCFLHGGSVAEVLNDERQKADWKLRHP